MYRICRNKSFYSTINITILPGDLLIQVVELLGVKSAFNLLLRTCKYLACVLLNTSMSFKTKEKVFELLCFHGFLPYRISWIDNLHGTLRHKQCGLGTNYRQLFYRILRHKNKLHHVGAFNRTHGLFSSIGLANHRVVLSEKLLIDGEHVYKVTCAHCTSYGSVHVQKECASCSRKTQPLRRCTRADKCLAESDVYWCSLCLSSSHVCMTCKKNDKTSSETSTIKST